MTTPPVPFAGCFQPDPELAGGCRLVFAGLPDASQSSFHHGSEAAPARIRAAYDGRCYNSCSERGVDLAGRVEDRGDLPSGTTWAETAQRYRHFAEEALTSGKIPFFAGGDHAVTVPVAEALAVLGEPIHVVQFDAHPDLYPEYEGNRHSHACTIHRLLEMPHIQFVTQIGIRASEESQRRVARRFQDRLAAMEARQAMSAPFPHPPDTAAVYVTLDLDALDPAFAPGVSHPLPGGLFPRPLLDWFVDARWRLVGMDVVEVNPSLDERDRTSILAARLLHEAMALALDIG